MASLEGGRPPPVTLVVKNPPAKASRRNRLGFDPWAGKIPWRRKWQLLQNSCLENPHGQRSLAGSGRSPGEGNGNLLQNSCLENSKDRGAWQRLWSTGSQTRLTRRRTHASLQSFPSRPILTGTRLHEGDLGPISPPRGFRGSPHTAQPGWKPPLIPPQPRAGLGPVSGGQTAVVCVRGEACVRGPSAAVQGVSNCLRRWRVSVACR